MSQRDEVIDLTSDNEENNSGSDDEDLKRAIALSLKEHQTSTHDSKSDLPKEKLKHDPTEKLSRSDRVKKIAELSQPSQSQSTSAEQSGMMAALDRRQMEAERLARLKRKRGEDTSTDSRTVSPPPLRRTVQPLPLRRDIDATPSCGPSTCAPLPYASGTILLTSVERSLPGSNATSMTDLLKPPDESFTLKSALLSTFISDFEWLFPHFATRSVSFVLVLHAASPEHKQLLTGDFAGVPNVRLVFPRVGGLVNCMHSKLMLLFYNKIGGQGGGVCRVVIPTANLTPADWGVQGVMENTVFVIDLPQAADGNVGTVGLFKKNLIQMLQAQEVPQAVVTKMDSFDFGHVQLGFIHSIGGAHLLDPRPSKANVNIGDMFASSSTGKITTTKNPFTDEPTGKPTRTGLHCLSDTIKALGLEISDLNPTSLPKLDYISSSIGNLKLPFLQSLFLACCGKAPETPIPSSSTSTSSKPRTSAGRANKTKTDQFPSSEQIQEKLRIYFPSEQTVEKSRGGPAAAGTICFQSKWWDAEGDSSSFPKSSLRDCVGVRNDRVLMHSKILYVRFLEPRLMAVGDWHISGRTTATDEKCKDTGQNANACKYYSGWVCVGSANLSESAWGTVVVDSKTKQPRLNCRNWESGVLIPVQVAPSTQKLLDGGHNLHDMTLQEVFGDVVPVPMKEPADTYDGRRPWFFH